MWTDTYSSLVVIVVSPALVITPIPCLRIAPILIISIIGITGLAILLIVRWLAVGCWWLLGTCWRVLTPLVASLSWRLLWISTCLPIVWRWILSSSSCCCGCLSTTWSLCRLLTCATVCSLRGRMSLCVAWVYLSAIPNCRKVLCFLGCTVQAVKKYTRHD